MSFGLITKTDFGFNLIDETFKSLCVVSSGTAALGSTISYAGINPIMAIDSHGVEFGMMEQGDAGGTFYWHPIRADGSSTGANFDYWIFDDVPATAPAGYGMVVRNAAGAIVFDSTHKYLRVVLGSEMVAGPKYAIVFCNGAVRKVSIDLGGSWSDDIHLNTAWIDSSNVLHFGDYLLSAGAPAGSDQGYAPHTDRMVVDVTNY